MANTITTRLAPSDFTPKSQRGQTDPTRYRIRPLTESEKVELCDHMELDQRYKASAYPFVCRLAVVGWTAIYNEDGNPIPFASALIDRCMRWEDQFEVGTEIINRATLSEDEVKNLSSQSTSENPQKTTDAGSATAIETPGSDGLLNP